MKKVMHRAMIPWVQKLTAENAGFKKLNFMIGGQMAPRPFLALTSTPVHSVPTAAMMINGMKDWNAFLITDKYLFSFAHAPNAARVF